MTLVRVHVTLVALAAGAFLALVGATGSAAATTTTCDTNPANAVRVGWSQAQIAPSGSLAPNNSTTLTATAVNSSGQCVAGASVVVFLDPAVGGGSATTTTAGCPVGRLTPNWDFCTADANGAVIVWYTAPATLPNGGTDSIHAQIGTQLPTSVSYTFGTLTLTATALTATEGASSTAVVATLIERDFATAPSLTPTVQWGDGSSSSAAVTPMSNTLAITASHTYAEESPVGGFITGITVSGLTAPTVTAGGSASVSDAALAASGVNVSGKPKTSLTGVPVATFTDSDPAEAAGDFSASIDWGDGTSSTGAIGSGFTVTGTHTYASRGSYTTTVTITDAGRATARATAIATITNSGGHR